MQVSLPTETATSTPFVGLYIAYILALQRRSSTHKQLPLAIMTSDDTHAATLELLKRHDYFGAAAKQITLLKQGKVPCLADTAGHLAMDEHDPYRLLLKPHGHGDVHSLLHSTGTAKKWAQLGFKWVAFFQDTNALSFRGLVPSLGAFTRRRLMACDTEPCCVNEVICDNPIIANLVCMMTLRLRCGAWCPTAVHFAPHPLPTLCSSCAGVSAENAWHMNSLCVPRFAKEAIGAICRLEQPKGGAMTINIEYNQLDPLLRSSGYPDGVYACCALLDHASASPASRPAADVAAPGNTHAQRAQCGRLQAMLTMRAASRLSRATSIRLLSSSSRMCASLKTPGASSQSL